MAKQPKIEIMVGEDWNADITIHVGTSPSPKSTKRRLAVVAVICLVTLFSAVTVYAMVTGNNQVFKDATHEAYKLGKILYKILRLMG